MLFTRAFKAMGSRCELKLYLAGGIDPDVVFDDLIRELGRLEAKYSRYLPDSVISQINRAAGTGQPIPIDEETVRLLDYADALYVQSDGLFDVTSGVLREIWNFRDGVLPSEEDIQATLPFIGWHRVERDGQQVHLPDAGMQIDFGGFGKEYAVDVLAVRCLDHDISHGVVNLGGDVRVVGPHPDGAPWRIGIQHPRSPGESIAVIECSEGSLATSGDYERFMLVDGKRYSHLLNPRTGRSLETHFASVSVLADSCLIAGSFSTLAMLKSHEAPAWLDDTELPHLLVDHSLNISGTIRT